MSTLVSRNPICLSCNQFNFCAVHWGSECKRQGGKKIPRMKSVPKEDRLKVNIPKNADRPERLEILVKPDKTGSQFKKMFEQIKTKVMNW